MLALKVTSIGNSMGLILPKEATAKLKIKKGDQIYLTEDSDGYRITPYNEELILQLKLAEKVMDEDRQVLRALAK